MIERRRDAWPADVPTICGGRPAGLRTGRKINVGGGGGGGSVTVRRRAVVVGGPLPARHIRNAGRSSRLTSHVPVHARYDADNSSATADGPRDALCQSTSGQL